MFVLGLDQSPTLTGFFAGDGKEPPAWGVKEHPDYADNEIPLIAHYREWLTNLVKSRGVEYIFYEQILVVNRTPKGSHRQGATVNVPVLLKQCAVTCSILCVAGDLSLPAFCVNITEWRDAFLGTHQAPKNIRERADWFKTEACAAALERGVLIEPKQHHAAEAMGIWEYGMAQLDPVFEHRMGPVIRRAKSRRDEERRAA
jgi:hypothetical protein